jgi:hypothetical protein
MVVMTNVYLVLYLIQFHPGLRRIMVYSLQRFVFDSLFVYLVPPRLEKKKGVQPIKKSPLLKDHDMLGLQTCISYVLEGFGNVPAWELLLC